MTLLSGTVLFIYKSQISCHVSRIGICVVNKINWIALGLWLQVTQNKQCEMFLSQQRYVKILPHNTASTNKLIFSRLINNNNNRYLRFTTKEPRFHLFTNSHMNPLRAASFLFETGSLNVEWRSRCVYITPPLRSGLIRSTLFQSVLLMPIITRHPGCTDFSLTFLPLQWEAARQREERVAIPVTAIRQH